MFSAFKLPDNRLRIVICSIAHRQQTFAKVVKYNTSRNQTVFLLIPGAQPVPWWRKMASQRETLLPFCHVKTSGKFLIVTSKWNSCWLCTTSEDKLCSSSCTFFCVLLLLPKVASESCGLSCPAAAAPQRQLFEIFSNETFPQSSYHSTTIWDEAWFFFARMTTLWVCLS